MFKFVAKRAFSSQNTLMGALNTQGNHNLRVMATPTWPVPYYQRAFRAEANLNMKDGDLMHVGVHLQAGHAMVAKEALKLEGNGYVVEAIEQHYDITNYCTEFADSNQFCEAYTDDLLDCIGLANEQNVRIMAEHDLGDALN